MYKELLEYLVKNLVNAPSSVKVECFEEGKKQILKLSVAKEDMGRVIGKDGRIIRSIKEILNAFAKKNMDRVAVTIDEEK